MWKNSDSPISNLPESIRKLFVECAKMLHEDLDYNYLEVILVPASIQMHEGHQIRVAVNHNSPWYSGMYWSWQTDHFKRHRAIDALERIINQKDGTAYFIKRHGKTVNGRYAYDAIFRDFIHEILTEGLEEYSIPPNKEANKYFNNASGIEWDCNPPDLGDIPF